MTTYAVDGTQTCPSCERVVDVVRKSGDIGRYLSRHLYPVAGGLCPKSLVQIPDFVRKAL